MKKEIRRFVILGILFFLPILSYGQKQDAQTAIHLLNYVSMDYSGAVENGKIINEQEYKEQIEFAARALTLMQESPQLDATQKSSVLEKIKLLQEAVASKVDAKTITQQVNTINGEIITATGIQTAPKMYPDLAAGEKIFATNCAVCHGTSGNGNGVGAKGLDPMPTNFHDVQKMVNLSPFQAYNSIRLGVPGTAMQPFSSLNDEQLWQLAFYVKSLRFTDAKNQKSALQKISNDLHKTISLADIATLNDKDLQEKLGDNSEEKLMALRSVSPTVSTSTSSLSVARKGLQDALESYQKGDKKAAKSYAISAYLEGIEPVEAQLRTRDGNFVTKLEGKMFAVRQAIDQNKSPKQLEQAVNEALELFNQADSMLSGENMSFWLTFIIAASIFLREGLEAFLVLAVVLAVIKKMDMRKALPWLHGGWIVAILLGILGWFMSDFILKFGGKNREIMEGLVSLSAVVILLFAGFWLHDKSHAKQWTNFVKGKIGVYLNGERMLGLTAFSFMVVFREAFEVILFLRALTLETAGTNGSAIGLGVLVAALFIFIFAVLFLKYSKMIPVNKLFKYSSFIVVLLAVVLTGKGVHSLQESGWVSVTNFPGMIHADWAGIYPTIETILGQLVVLIIIFIAYFFSKRKAEKLE